MSLWTPGGERPVGRSTPDSEPSRAGGAGTPDAELDPEARAQAEAIAAEMAQVREQLAQAPAAVVVANHAMGLYELAAIHLNQQPPNLEEARVAIDAFAALLGSVGDRLGEDGEALGDALNQLRLAFVQLSSPDQPMAEPAPGEEG